MANSVLFQVNKEQYILEFYNVWSRMDCGSYSNKTEYINS